MYGVSSPSIYVPDFKLKNMTEIWKDIKGYEDCYQISSFGRIKSKRRYVKHNYGGLKILKEKFLSSNNIDSGGYCIAVLCKNGGRKTFKIHRLVCLHFLKNNKNKPHVNHKDGNKSNNYISNLEWCTRSENVRHAIKTGLLKIKKGKEHHNYGGNPKTSIKVLNKSTGKIYNTIREASEDTIYTKRHLAAMLRGDLKNKTNFIYA